jgi:WbqC-like protein family
MKLTVHQPNFLPYLGFFDKCDYSEILVLYNSTQFKKNDFQNRNKIAGKGGEVLLTIPVNKKFGQKINEVKINNSKKWKEKHLKSLENCYSKSKYFLKYFSEIKEVYYAKNWEFLSDFNIYFIKFLLKKLKISCNILLSSEMNLRERGSDALMEICEKLNLKEYISGTNGRKYLVLDKFKEKEILVRFQNYAHPRYNQEGIKFKPYLSILDLLFNEGPNSLKVLKSGRYYGS